MRSSDSADLNREAVIDSAPKEIDIYSHATARGCETGTDPEECSREKPSMRSFGHHMAARLGLQAIKQRMRHRPSRLRCSEIFNEMCILADGRAVCSCIDAIAQHTLGNVHENRLYDIFNAYSYQNLRNHLINLTVPELCTTCPLRRMKATRCDQLVMPTVETVQIEIANVCDLKCPQCTLNLVRRPDHAGAIMSYETFADIIDQLKGPLRTLKFYNYGEPFIHKDCMKMLRYVKEADPEISVLINTNGTHIGPERQRELVDLGIDMLIFSVDGATQESYERYRVGGDLGKVLGNMKGILEYRKGQGKQKPKILWQYILFDWNDSDEEVSRAKRMAVEMEVDVLHWLLTHTPGASSRFTSDSGSLRQLLVREGLGRKYTAFYLDASPVREVDEHGYQAVNLKWKTRYRRVKQLLSSFGKYPRDFTDKA